MTPEHPRTYQVHDEIDLFELAADLWEQKWLILLITGICTALAAGYALLATPVYQASARFLPPLSMNIAPLNQLRVTELRELQQQHEALDSPATAPSGPVKPRKNMIIALGVVLGGMLGVGVALVRMALRSRRETQD